MSHIGIIGAGASGLVAMKELLDEGHTVTCFEKYPQEGGVFFYSEDKGGVYDSTLLTISNYFMAFSSLPPLDGERRKFWTHQEYASYLRHFAEKFNLFPYIHFNTEVLSVDLSDTNKVVVEVTQQGEKKSYTFDAIAICTGTHQKPKFPEFKNKELFQGKIEHSAFYKNAKPYAGKRVITVGMGETASDIVHEIAQVATDSMLSIRHYPAVIPRYILYEIDGFKEPGDSITCRLLYSLPTSVLNKGWEIVSNKFYEEDPTPANKLLSKWTADCGGLANQFLTKNEIFLPDIADDKVKVNLSGIRELTKDKVIFNDGTEFLTDVIMCNTGYEDDFSFIKGMKIKTVKDLYKHAFHPEFGKRIAFIGWARPAEGGVPACSEMQARYFALLCSGKRQLPEKDELYKIITNDKKFEETRYCKSQIPSLVHYKGYMNALAKMIDCEPSIMSLCFTNPKLFYKIIYGSQVSYQYRLRGPHAKPEMAKEVILRLPVVWRIKDMILLSTLSIFSNLLASARIIKKDLKYK